MLDNPDLPPKPINPDAIRAVGEVLAGVLNHPTLREMSRWSTVRSSQARWLLDMLVCREEAQRQGRADLVDAIDAAIKDDLAGAVLAEPPRAGAPS